GAAFGLAAATARGADTAPPLVLDETTVIAKSRVLYQAYRASDAARLWQDFDDRLRQAMGSPEAFDSTLKRMARQIGDVEQCNNERVDFEKDYWFYRADCLCSRSP